MKRSFIREILESITPETISFAGGLPDEHLFPHEALRTSANRILSDPSHLQYSTSSGILPLREQIAAIYSRQGFETHADNILITSGSQQALDLLSRHYRDRSITIESPSYLGAMGIFALNHLHTEAITLEHDGIAVDPFIQSLKQTQLTYLIPDYQNPTGRTYRMNKRKTIAAQLQKHGAILIEDAPYSDLYFECRQPAISSMIPEQSYHLGSFSKSLAPALRIGWIRASEDLLHPLLVHKEAMDLHTNSLMQYILHDYLLDPDQHHHHLETLRQHYAQKMEAFSELLKKHLPGFIFEKPKGGMFIYGTLSDVDTAELVQRSLTKGVVFVPGCEFYTEGGEGMDEIRFNFTYSDIDAMERGIKILARCL